MRNLQKIALLMMFTATFAAFATNAEAAPKLKGNGPKAEKRQQDELNVAQRNLAEAHRLMARALPIYQGNRVLSMDWTKVARGYIGIARQPGADTPNARGPKLDPTSEGNGRHTAEQIARSQELMKKALEKLQIAARALQGATAPNVQALNLARAATASSIQACEKAISLRGGTAPQP